MNHKPQPMKRTLIPLLAFVLSFIFIINACQKDEAYIKPTKSITSINAKILRIVDNKKGGLNIFVSVTDQNGVAIENLSNSNFNISMINNNGEETPIPMTDSTSLPSLIITALTMDYSGSMFDDSTSVPAMETALTSFVNMKNSYDQIEIIKFSDSLQVTVPFTNNTTTLLNGITDTTFYGHGYTAFYKAVIKGLDDVQNLAINNPTYLPSIIGFTDGVNNLPPLTMDSLLNNSILNQIPVYTVGYGVNPDTIKLKTIADSTGGAYAWNPSSSSLSILYQIVNGQLSNSVVIPIMGPNNKGKVTYRVKVRYFCEDGLFNATDEKYFYY